VVDLLWASPNCQPYSRAGKKQGALDPRDGWPATVAAISQIQPRWIVIENVQGAPVDSWQETLQALGYTTSAALLDAADWGLPSHRTRWYLVAGPTGMRWPAPTHHGPQVPWLLRAGRQPWVGFGEALGQVGAVRSTREPGPIAQRTERILQGPSQCIGAERYGTRAGQPYVLIPGNGGHLPLPRASTDPAHAVTASCPQYLAPSPTITCVDGVGLGGSHSRGQIQQALGRRRLTWQECATLVGFPPDYPFQGGGEARYRQIGNAVAPIMAQVLGQQLRELAWAS
jgi:DNA (cytosine-5)-methyltransferase 1